MQDRRLPADKPSTGVRHCLSLRLRCMLQRLMPLRVVLQPLAGPDSGGAPESTLHSSDASSLTVTASKWPKPCYIQDATGGEMLSNIQAMVAPLLELAGDSGDDSITVSIRA